MNITANLPMMPVHPLNMMAKTVWKYITVLWGVVNGIVWLQGRSYVEIRVTD